jgi:hypothetical protein
MQFFNVLASFAVAALLAEAGGAPSPSADPALLAPPVNTAPGPEYADDTRLFQGIPGIERAANGRLWALWYAGGKGEGPENYAVLVTSGDDGKTWSGSNYLIYDFSRTGDKQILMAAFTEDDVAQGQWLSACARQRVVVNQATGKASK